jgi:hypothetical protein
MSVRVDHDRMKNDRMLNRLTLVLLGLTALVLACYLIIFLVPASPLNPWPPIAQAPLMTLAPTVAPKVTLPPTWTPTPVQTYQALATRPPDTPLATRTPLASRTPTKSPALPTRSPYKFTPVRDPVLVADKYGAACGNWGGAGGQVLDLNGAPLTGVSVAGWGGPIPEQDKRVFVSGSDARLNKFYGGEGAYELYIGAPGDFDFFVVVYENGRPVSPVVKVRMVNDCTRDLALINFQRNF